MIPRSFPVRFWWLLLPWLACVLAHTACATTLVATNSSWRLFKGTAEPTPVRSAWRQLSFNDASWTPRSAPFSYGKNISRGTVLTDMQGNYSTLYLRIHFNVADPSQHGFPILRAACDDGFIAYLNGREIARYNVGPGDRPFDSHLAPDHATAPAPEPTGFLDYPVGISSPLVAGDNVLAVQVLNCLVTSSDVLFDAELVTPVGENIPPTVTSVSPLPGETSDLSRVTITFSEPVTGVEAGDFVINGFPATGMRVLSSRTYEFAFAPLPYGRVDAGWIPDHGITDAAASPNPFRPLAPGNTWSWQLFNPDAPRLVSRLPAPGVVRQFSSVDVVFSEPVTGVDATDLLVNGSPATSVSGLAAGPWHFTFPPLTQGTANIRFAPDHGITDLDSRRNAFAGAEWSVTINPAQTDPTVRITELLAANTTQLKDEDGGPQPWIEIHNFGTGNVDLAGLGLADNPEGDNPWVFPSVTLAPDQRLVVFASGKDRRGVGPGRFLHTDFKLAREGEFVGLFNAESPRRAISALPGPYPAQRNDISWGLTSTGTWEYFQTPTPGAPNTGPRLSDACDEVRFSVERGCFSSAFELILTTSTPGAVIRYTVNGCDPNATNSFVYSGPIPILRTTSVRANAVREGLLPSRTRTHTYLIGLSSAQRGLPALSIVTDTNHLTGPTGIVGMQGGTRDSANLWIRRTTNDYYNPNNRGIAWERPASVEWITAAHNGEFQIDAGLRLHASDYFRPRLLPTSKFSWRIYFRGDYGSGRLQFPLIPAADVDQFDALVCRAGSNDLNPFVRDEIMRRLLADCGQVSARGTFATLFLNGRYAGFYNPVERVEADFLSLHHGGGSEWDVMSQSGVIDGDRTNWDLLNTEIQSGTATDNTWYRTISGRLDVTNFVDYLLVNAFGYNGDWPGNNWRTARERKPGAPWRHYIWDAEFALGMYGRSVSGNTFNEISGTYVGTFYSRLRQHPEFRLLFADRAHRHLFNGGALTTTNILRHFSETSRGLSGLISGFDPQLTNWVRSRTPIFYSQLVSLGLCASTNAPVFRQHGGRIPAGFALSLTNLGGDIWFTTDGSDPRVAFSGAVAPGAIRYNPASPPLLDASVQIRARTLASNTWSALTEAAFSLGDPQPPVRLSELMYQPPGGSEFEFVELRNLSSRAVDLSGFVFEGIECRFPNNTLLPAQGVWVIASDKRPTAFASRYPGVTVNAWFNGSLDNAGEWIALRDADGGLVDRVRYRPQDGWPTQAAGSGASLERIDFGLDANDPAAWRASPAPGGSPGAAPIVTQVAPTLRIDEVFASNAGRIVRGTHTPDFVEIRNLSSSPIDLAGWSLRRADRSDQLVLSASTRFIPPAGRFVAWFGDAAPGDVAAPFRLASNGGVLILANPTNGTVSTFAYGPQAADRSVGFIAGVSTPTLLDPTPGGPNLAIPTAPVSRAVLNEWLANPAPGSDDFIELFNPDPTLPVFLPGCWLAVSNSIQVLRFPSAIAPRGFATFKANEGGQPDELPFRLPAPGNVIRLFDPAGRVLDEVRYTNALEGVASGRFPDGSTNRVSLPSGGTPDQPNLLTPQAGPQISEILASGTFGDPSPDRARDWIELVNTATTNVSIGAWRIALREPQSRSWSVPAGVVLSPDARIRIFADPTAPASTASQSPLNTGFGLPDAGGVLEWQDPAGTPRQRIAFGPQVPGLSIGTDSSGVWNLLVEPTPTRTNAPPAALAFGEQVCINEWLAAAVDQPDFIELFNPHNLPVDLSGWALTDDPSLAGMHRYKLPPLSFIDAMGWLVIHADNNPSDGPTHAPYELSSSGESLRLYRSSGTPVDTVTVLPTSTDATRGRFPDGTLNLGPLTRPTPGSANLVTLDADNDGLPDSWETAYGLNPANPADAAADPDGDGRSNLDEFLAGTDPRNPASVLSLVATSGQGTVTLSFNAETGRSYALQQRESLNHAWSVLAPVAAAPNPRRLSLTLTTTNAVQRLFRIVTPAP